MIPDSATLWTFVYMWSNSVLEIGLVGALIN